MLLKRIFYFSAMFALGFFLAACERTKISEINADPGRYMNKEVAVIGQVTQSIGALGKGIYQVDDGTGRLWVVANVRGVPSKGAKVGVKGHVKPTITFLGINYATVMEETDRHGE
jgi:RecJ-like exonuclease